VIAVGVPLHGAAFRRFYVPRFERDGRFVLTTDVKKYPHEVALTKVDFKGWEIKCSMPTSLFGSVIPDKLGCNIIAKVSGDSGTTGDYSWVTESALQMFAPIRWGGLRLKSRPITQNPWTVWFACFAAGFVVTTGGWYLVRRVRRRPDSVARLEINEQQKALLERFKRSVEERITDTGLTIDEIATELSVPAKAINRLLKRYLGQTFHTYLMRERLAIAKERLRSSNSSEISIADQCGFVDVNEMEKVFLRFLHTTPFKYRSEQQVT
jgi:AraC-like DNA-binding protein